MRFLKQSVAVTAVIGPALDKTDGVTEKTGLTPTAKISKNNAAFVTRDGSASALAHDTNGWYRCPLSSTDTGTLGPLVIIFQDSAVHLPVWHEFSVVPANVYDSLISGSDNLDVAIPIGAFAASSISAAAFSSNTIVSDVIASNAFGIGKFAASALSAGAFSSSTIAQDIIGASAINSTKISSNSIVADVINASAFSNAKFAAGAIGTDTLASNAIGIGKFAASALSAGAFSNNTIVASVIDKTGYSIASNGIAIGSIAASAIAASTYAANAIDASVIASNAIGIGKFAASALSAAAFSSNSIVADLIGASALAQAKFAASAFTNANFKAGAIDAASVASDVSTEIWDTLCTEPTSVVSASPKAIDALSWIVSLSRNKLLQTSAAISVRNNADDGTIASATVADSGGTFTRGEFV